MDAPNARRCKPRRNRLQNTLRQIKEASIVYIFTLHTYIHTEAYNTRCMLLLRAVLHQKQ